MFQSKVLYCTQRQNTNAFCQEELIMKKKLIATLFLVALVSLLLCSCSADNSGSDRENNNNVTTTTVIIQGDSQSITPTNNNDTVTTVPSIPTDEVTEPTEDEITEPTEGDVTEPTEDEVVEPTETPTQAPTQAPATTKAPTTTQAHKHSYTAKVTKAATCTAEGVKTYTCSCGDKYTEAIAKIAHTKDSGTVTKAATCTATGTKTYKCTVCKAVVDTADIAALGHNYKNGSVVKPTCTKEGYTNSICSRCNDTKQVNKVAATGHSWGSWTTTKAATVLAKGTSQRKCSKCSETDSKDIAQLDNNYVNNNITNQPEYNICVIPEKVWFTSDGELHVTVRIYNNSNMTVTGFSVNEMSVDDNKNTEIAYGTFYNSPQNLTISAGRYITHTYDFGTNTIKTYTPDMSDVHTHTLIN